MRIFPISGLDAGIQGFMMSNRQRHPRSDRLTLADFRYQEERDEYRCPQGRVLGLRGKKPSMMESFIEGIAMGEIAVRDVNSRSGASREEGETQHGDDSCGECLRQLNQSHGG